MGPSGASACPSTEHLGLKAAGPPSEAGETSDAESGRQGGSWPHLARLQAAADVKADLTSSERC